MVWASTIDQPISFLAFLKVTAGSAAFLEIFFFLYFGLAAVGFLCSEYAISQLYSFLFRHAQPVWDDFKQYPRVAQSTGNDLSDCFAIHCSVVCYLLLPLGSTPFANWKR